MRTLRNRRLAMRVKDAEMDGLRKLTVVIIALALILVLLGSLAGAQPWGGLGAGWGMGPGMMGRMMGAPREVAPVVTTPPAVSTPRPEEGWPVVSWALVAVLVGGAAGGAWVFSTRTQHAPDRSPTRETPLEIAERRYVSGEITLPEYEVMVQVLLERNEPPARGKG